MARLCVAEGTRWLKWGSVAKRRSWAATLRRDAWWVEIMPVIVVLGGFGLYATLRAFEGKFYEWGPYLSPFYSPLIDAHHHWWKLSPALLILGGPLGFRATCYYYRKAYYRAFFLDPPACAVGEGRRSYSGETKFPFILQNLHRYFLYLAIISLVFLWKDAIQAFFFDGKFGIGVGTLVLLVNICLLTTYTLSCHSLRHLGGREAGLFFLRDIWQATSQGVAGLSVLERAAHAVCVDELVFGGIGGFLHAAGVYRRDSRREDLLSDKFETHEQDVLVIGAGGAGLRAAIEALATGRVRGRGEQIAAGQSAHGDGGGRNRRGHGQRGFRGRTGARIFATPCAAGKC